MEPLVPHSTLSADPGWADGAYARLLSGADWRCWEQTGDTAPVASINLDLVRPIYEDWVLPVRLSQRSLYALTPNSRASAASGGSIAFCIQMGGAVARLS
jgi:hypothetical protein